MHVLDPLYHLAAKSIVFFHKGFGPIFGQQSFFSWAFSVVLLVVCVRILIFPLFVKQVKSQRTMQMIQPRIKEIREKYANDKPKMQSEIMALQREHGNPLLGCLPLLLQIPLFISLFHVFNSLVPRKDGHGSYHYVATVGLSAQQVESIASAKIWGISLSTAFTSSKGIVNFLHADLTHIRIVAVLMIILMGASTFLTQKQIMGRGGPIDPQQAMIQKVLLYVSPVMLAVFGFRFPIAVLTYWLTTNLWSMGQQFFVIRKMPPVTPLGPGGKIPGARPGTPGGGKVVDGKATTVSKPAPGVRPNRGGAKSAAGKAASVDMSKSGASAERVTQAPKGTSSRASLSKANGTAQPGGADSGTPADGSGAGSNGNGRGARSAQSGDGANRPATPSVAAAGTRRPPGGSRPAKKRGKGQRRGGRR